MRKSQFSFSSAEGTLSQLITVALVFPVLLTLFAVVSLRASNDGTAAGLATLKLASGEWAPYSGANIAQRGIAGAVVEETMRRMGYQVESQFMPWSVVEKMTAKSESNAGINAAYPFLHAPERERDFVFSSEPLVTIRNALFHVGDEPPPSLDDLAKRPWILIAGYRYAPLIEQTARRGGVEHVANTHAGFDLLFANKKPYVMPEAEAVGWLTARDDFPREVRTLRTFALPEAVRDVPLYLIAPRRNAASRRLLRDFDRMLKSLKDSGDYRAIVANAEHAIDEAQTVRVQPAIAGQAVVATGKDGEFALPEGSRVIVEEWGLAFFPSSPNVSTADLNTKIRIFDGPLAGSEAHVDGRDLRLQHAP